MIQNTPFDVHPSSKETKKSINPSQEAQRSKFGRSGDVTMSKVPTDMVSCINYPNLNVVPPSAPTSPPKSSLNELDDNYFIEVILANNNANNTMTQNLSGSCVMEDCRNTDSMVTQNMIGSHVIGDFDMFDSQTINFQSNIVEDKDDPLMGLNAFKKKGKPLGSKNKRTGRFLLLLLVLTYLLHHEVYF